MSNLYIVATPIGNLEDISKRALRILSEVDLILCEDTRVTMRLLDHYEIKTPSLSYHQHSKIQKVDYIINLLKQGKNIALVSDAGTPGISDPGGKLIETIIHTYAPNQPWQNSGVGSYEVVKIIPVPGPSALLAAASVSGFPMDKFLFLGFPPQKKKRKKFFDEIISSKYPVIFYESPYRIIKSLEELKSVAESSNIKLELVICRELTKKFETIYRGNIEKTIGDVKNNKIKGEFVVVIKKYEK